MQIDPLDLLRALSLRLLVVDENAQVVVSLPTERPDIDLHALLPLLETRVPFRTESPLPEGGWLHFRGAPLEGGRSAIAVMPESGLRQSLLVRLLKPLLWRVGRDGRILETTDELARWLGTTSEAMVATHVEDWLVTKDSGEKFEGEFHTLGMGKRRALVQRTSPDYLGGGWIDLVSDVTEQHRAKSRLADEVNQMRRLAHTDPLTGVLNRRAFDTAFQDLCDKQEPYALAFIDVDDMKGLNDNHGHTAGDQALVAIANALRNAVRDSDVIARIGGDEFAVLLPYATTSVVERVEPRLRDCLAVPLEGIGLVQASMGLVHGLRCTEDVIKKADAELYDDKQRRRDFMKEFGTPPGRPV